MTGPPPETGSAAPRGGDESEAVARLAADPGPRFAAPAAAPAFVGRRAADVAALAGVPLRLDRRCALGILAFWGYSAERSLFEDVRLVPPRCEVRRTEGGRWEIRPGRGPAPLSIRFDAAASVLRAALAHAVEDALRPSERAAVLLSGGLDSSTVAVLAAEAWRRLGREPKDLVLCHTVPAQGPTELPHAEAVARALGHPLTVVAHTDEDVFAGTEVVFARNDIPADGGGPGAELRVLRRLHDDGVQCVLTGDGGDEIATGFYVRPWRRPAPLATALAWGAHTARAGARGLWLALGGGRARLRRATRGCGVPGWLASRLTPEDLPQAFPPARLGLVGAASRRDRSLRSGRHMVLVSSWRAIGGAAGVRVEIPFYDAAVGDLVVALPQEHFAAGSGDKGILRRAMEGSLPEAVRQRPKEQPPMEPMIVRQWRAHGGEWLERYVAGSALERLDLVPEAGRRDVLAHALDGPLDALHRAMAVVSLGAWCQARGL